MEATYLQFGLESFPVVKTEVVLNTELLKISVSDLDAQKASDLANFIAGQVIERIRLSSEIANENVLPLPDNTLGISVVEPASPPNSPNGPSKRLFVIMGFLVGAMGGIGLAFLFENLDTRIYSSQMIEQIAGSNIIGEIPPGNRLGRMKFLFVIYPHAEAFRQLRTNVLTAMKDQNLKTLLIVSAEPQEGKSTITANLACSIAQTSKRVLTIDADMRRPSMHEILGVERDVGLSDALRGEFSVEDAVMKTAFVGVDILTAGAIPHNPAELLESNKMAEVIAHAEQDYDVVLIDTPAVLAVADPSILAEESDGILIVVRRGRTTYDAIENVYKQMGKVNANIIGVIANYSERDNYWSYYGSHMARRRIFPNLLKRRLNKRDIVAELQRAKTISETQSTESWQ
jgi:capsular exopolysaccharide synthesis family protein